MKFRLIALALAALAAPAFATTTAGVTTSSFDVTLKDLNTGDAVTPGFTWDASWYLYANSGYAQQTGYDVQSHSWGNSIEAKFGSSVTSFLSTQAPNGTLSGSVVNGLGNYSVELDAGGRPTLSLQTSIGAGISSSASAQMSRGFWLTAGTQVTFSALVDRHVSGTAYAGTLPGGINGWPTHSSAVSSLDMYVGSLNSSLAISASNDFLYQTQAYENTGEGDLLKLTIKNTGTSSQYYLFSVSAYVYTTELLDPATAVPEPGTYGLMALGLIGVGAAARRRKA